MNTSINRDARNEAAQVLSRMFAGRAITGFTTNGGTDTLTLDNGETVTIRHETLSDYDNVRTENTYTNGFGWRARESFDNKQTILSVWVEINDIYLSLDECGKCGGTTEIIELWAMFDRDTRPTLLTDDRTEYKWDVCFPDFTITRGDETVTARDAHIDAE